MKTSFTIQSFSAPLQLQCSPWEQEQMFFYLEEVSMTAPPHRMQHAPHWHSRELVFQDKLPFKVHWNYVGQCNSYAIKTDHIFSKELRQPNDGSNNTPSSRSWMMFLICQMNYIYFKSLTTSRNMEKPGPNSQTLKHKIHAVSSPLPPDGIVATSSEPGNPVLIPLLKVCPSAGCSCQFSPSICIAARQRKPGNINIQCIYLKIYGRDFH